MKNVLVGLALVCAVGVIIVSCSGGGGGGAYLPPPTPPANYQTPDQAAASASAASTAPMAASAFAGVGMGYFSGLTIPAGLAPQLTAQQAKAVAALDPRLATLLNRVKSDSQSAMVQAAMKKAGALKASRVNSIDASFTTEAGCTASGSVRIVGTNNYDDTARTYDDANYTFTYDLCSDGTGTVNGTVAISAHDGVSTAIVNETVSMTNLTFTESAGTVVLNGTFGTSLDLSDPSNQSMTQTANGTFVQTASSSGISMTFSMGSLSNTITAASDTTQRTMQLTANGSASYSVQDSAGTALAGFSMSFSGLTDKYQYLNDGTGTAKEWLNGTVVLSWSPDIAGCSPGSVTFVTDDATPITTTTAGGVEPVSGTFKVNDATIQFATPSGTQITVTLGNGTSTVYPNMAAFETTGSVCMI